MIRLSFPGAANLCIAACESRAAVCVRVCSIGRSSGQIQSWQAGAAFFSRPWRIGRKYTRIQAVWRCLSRSRSRCAPRPSLSRQGNRQVADTLNKTQAGTSIPVPLSLRENEKLSCFYNRDRRRGWARIRTRNPSGITDGCAGLTSSVQDSIRWGQASCTGSARGSIYPIRLEDIRGAVRNCLISQGAT